MKKRFLEINLEKKIWKKTTKLFSQSDPLPKHVIYYGTARQATLYPKVLLVAFPSIIVVVRVSIDSVWSIYGVSLLHSSRMSGLAQTSGKRPGKRSKYCQRSQFVLQAKVRGRVSLIGYKLFLMAMVTPLNFLTLAVGVQVEPTSSKQASKSIGP